MKSREVIERSEPLAGSGSAGTSLGTNNGTNPHTAYIAALRTAVGAAVTAGDLDGARELLNIIERVQREAVAGVIDLSNERSKRAR